MSSFQVPWVTCQLIDFRHQFVPGLSLLGFAVRYLLVKRLQKEKKCEGDFFGGPSIFQKGSVRLSNQPREGLLYWFCFLG